MLLISTIHIIIMVFVLVLSVLWLLLLLLLSWLLYWYYGYYGYHFLFRRGELTLDFLAQPTAPIASGISKGRARCLSKFFRGLWGLGFGV